MSVQTMRLDSQVNQLLLLLQRVCHFKYNAEAAGLNFWFLLVATRFTPPTIAFAAFCGCKLTPTLYFGNTDKNRLILVYFYEIENANVIQQSNRMFFGEEL